MDAAVVTDLRGQRIVRVLRAVFAVYGLIALLWIPVRNAGSPDFSPANYLSYFTIESNILAVVVLLIGAVRDPQSRGWQLFRGATTLYMVITGIVYAVLLAQVDVMLQDAWINTALHRLLPLVLLVDWVIAPSRVRITDARCLSWLVFPVVYGVYSLIRGPIVDWYPYPFLDPREQGYLQLAVTAVVLLLAMALMALAVNAVGRLGARRRYGEVR
ncbi:Pr6Pr family membrane protein [Rhodococcus sp. NPDC056960]|uniref:Pr6Pr family membrane protein n=1 Tax=Rhodococcus sp. NPDC056960 TaxID=3345982 RepID=UPI00362C7B64